MNSRNLALQIILPFVSIGAVFWLQTALAQRAQTSRREALVYAKEQLQKADFPRAQIEAITNSLYAVMESSRRTCRIETTALFGFVILFGAGGMWEFARRSKNLEERLRARESQADVGSHGF